MSVMLNLLWPGCPVWGRFGSSHAQSLPFLIIAQHRTVGSCLERRKSMHARVLTAPFQPGKLDSLLSRLHENVLPAARQHEGFKQVLLLTDPHTNKAIHLSFWETEG